MVFAAFSPDTPDENNTFNVKIAPGEGFRAYTNVWV
jgi:hypothetical protein